VIDHQHTLFKPVEDCPQHAKTPKPSVHKNIFLGDATRADTRQFGWSIRARIINWHSRSGFGTITTVTINWDICFGTQTFKNHIIALYNTTVLENIRNNKKPQNDWGLVILV